MTFQSAYRKLLEQKKFSKLIFNAEKMLENCVCCGWECGVNRLKNEIGVCRTGEFAKIASYGPHFGEEKPIRGFCGSGTVFFTGCNLRCQYCQNATISQTEVGEKISSEDLAVIFLELQNCGCHNINLVSPTHVVPQIIKAIYHAAQDGLAIPVVYNTGGYDSLQALSLLDGIVDIYMPDMKYASKQIAQRYSRIANYPAINQTAVFEMHRQVGDLDLDGQGIARRGLLVRHLILPNGLAGTENIVQFLADKISRKTYLNLMDQYRPVFKANQNTKLSRQILTREFTDAVQMALNVGIIRLDHLQ